MDEKHDERRAKMIEDKAEELMKVDTDQYKKITTKTKFKNGTKMKRIIEKRSIERL